MESRKTRELGGNREGKAEENRDREPKGEMGKPVGETRNQVQGNQVQGNQERELEAGKHGNDEIQVDNG